MTTSDEVEADPVTPSAEVRYAIPRFAEPSKRVRLFLVGANVCFLALAVWQLSIGRIPLMPILALLTSAYAAWRVRARGRDAVATTEGISGPHLRHPLLWRDVACLVEAGRYDPEIYVVLNDESRKGTGFPPSYFERLQHLTDVPVRPYSPFG